MERAGVGATASKGDLGLGTVNSNTCWESVSKGLQSAGSDLSSIRTQVAVAVGDRVSVAGTQGLPAYARSTAKILIASALLKRVGGPQALSPSAAEDFRLAIADSDNDAALRLFEELGTPRATPSTELNQFLRRNSLEQPVIPEAIPNGLPSSFISPYGAALWQPSDQVKFIRSVVNHRALSSNDAEYLLDLMASVTPTGGSTWGLGALDSVSSAYKAGWGDNPDGTFLARQVGVVYSQDSSRSTPTAINSVGLTQEEAYSRASRAAEILTEALGEECL